MDDALDKGPESALLQGMIAESLWRKDDEVPSTSVAARTCRRTRETNPEIAAVMRARLHVRAEVGEEWGTGVLGLLADDPWWGERDLDLEARAPAELLGG